MNIPLLPYSALTGHLVLSTLHTNDAIGAIAGITKVEEVSRVTRRLS